MKILKRDPLRLRTPRRRTGAEHRGLRPELPITLENLHRSLQDAYAMAEEADGTLVLDPPCATAIIHLHPDTGTLLVSLTGPGAADPGHAPYRDGAPQDRLAAKLAPFRAGGYRITPGLVVLDGQAIMTWTCLRTGLHNLDEALEELLRIAPGL